MRHLVIYTHPNPKSFNRAILETFVNELKALRQEVRVRDLYEIDFDPVIRQQDYDMIRNGTLPDDIRQEQEYIAWADILTFIFPIFWVSLPARLKGYIDRVFSQGFAFRLGDRSFHGLLDDKRVVLINTTETPREVYDKSGMLASMNQTIEGGIFRYCGMEVVNHTYFMAVPSCTDNQRQDILMEVRSLAGMIS